MIKVFTTNKDGKIELTKDELKALLDEAYWEGYRANSHSWIYTTPTWAPYQWTVTNATNEVTLSSIGAAESASRSNNTTAFATGTVMESKEE